jgi:hypothetical protein
MRLGDTVLMRTTGWIQGITATRTDDAPAGQHFQHKVLF